MARLELTCKGEETKPAKGESLDHKRVETETEFLEKFTRPLPAGASPVPDDF